MAIVVSILERDVDALVRVARAAAASADVVELRLDHLRAGEVERLKPVIAELAKPVIAAVHGAEGFGGFAGSAPERFELLRAAARSGATFVDIDARFAAEFGVAPAGARRIVSHHEKEGTPDDVAALFARVDASARPEDLVKIVTHARSAEDGLRVLAALRASARERVGFCSGERGSFTRALAPLAGSRFTYAAPKAELANSTRSSAPGQLRVDELRSMLPAGLPTRASSPRWFAVLGRPIAHSWSPRLHNAVFRARDLDATYVACEPDDVARFLELALALPFDGFSITAPFKSDVLRSARSADSATGAIGAANTLVRRGDAWHALNTDAAAIVGALQAALAPRALSECTALVVGTGGAARAALWSLQAAGARVAVHGRDLERALALCDELGGAALAANEIERARFDVLVHATPAGSRASDDACCVPREWIRAGAVVLDAVYRPRETELLRRARERGARAISGLEWFQRQAVAQAVFFTRQDELEPIVEIELASLSAQDVAG